MFEVALWAISNTLTWSSSSVAATISVARSISSSSGSPPSAAWPSAATAR